MVRKAVLTDERQQRKEIAESDLERFIELVHPKRLLGNVHREIIRRWTSQEAKSHQLLLLPRDHMKSALVAYRTAWAITKDPTLKVLFISSTSNLAVKQLKFIKDILTLSVYRLYWPDMIEEDETKREKWTEREISVDHPKRKDEAIRDPTIFTAGLTSNIVGMHSDITVMDDVVVHSNAYTDLGREKVKEQYGYLSSIGAGSVKEWVVGTRYHPLDLYANLIEREIESFDELGNVVRREPLFEVFERQVENVGDGTGQFIWPKQQRSDGKWFGFDSEILAKKRSSYSNKTHFRAQYYNDPHDVDSSPIQREQFQYYNPSFLLQRNGKWFFKGERLNICASIDFAYTSGKKSDYTAIVVVGVDGNRNYYVLDIDRFRTNKISDYFKSVFSMHEKWGFLKLRAEITAAQEVIVKDLKENYIRPRGLALVIEEFRPSKWIGSKEERILAVLEPKYANRQIWHYPSGYCQTLEEELIFANPAHDDIKDALASAIDFSDIPTNSFRLQRDKTQVLDYHPRFGGIY